MNYQIKTDPNSSKFLVFETQTEQVVKEFVDKSAARKFMKHLNLGGGFDGWSPTFIFFNFRDYINKATKKKV